MISLSEMRNRLEQMLSAQVSLNEFERWFASSRQEIHRESPLDVQEFAFAIDDKLSQFDEDSAALRSALRSVSKVWEVTPTLESERSFEPDSGI